MWQHMKERHLYSIPCQEAILYAFTTQYFYFISMYHMRAMFTTKAFGPYCGFILRITLMPNHFEHTSEGR